MRTEGGEVIPADVVIDDGGRRTPVPSMIEAIGGGRVGRPGLIDRVPAVSAAHEPYRTPAPTRAGPEQLLV